MTKRLSISNVTVLLLLVLVALLGSGAGAHSASSAIVVSISSPTGGQTVTGKITWEAKVTTGTADSVSYAIDGTTKWTEYLAPYIYNGDGNTLDTSALSNGTHTLSVTAKDAQSNASTASIQVTVSNGSATPPPPPPSSSIAVSIASPSNGQTVAGKQTWEAKVTTGSASSVAFAIDGTTKWTEYVAPYIYNGDGNTLDTATLTNGAHTLSVTAKDAQSKASTASIQVTVSNGSAPPPPPPPASSSKFYSSSSPFNIPIASGAAIDGNSGAMVQTVVNAATAQNFVVASKAWSVPVYYANSSTPKVTVSLTASWAAYKKLASVPMPSGAAPDPSGDGHMMIVDTSTGCEYDFFAASHRSDGSWAASWGNTMLTSGTGIFPYGLSTREAGFGLGAGLILPSEMAAGQINHALNFSYPYTKTGGPVLPATEASGKSSIAGAIPEGAHLQLDPALNLDSLGLNAWQKTVARALQKYGMFLSDTGGGVSVYAQNPQSGATYPWGSETYPALPTSLVSHFRVLKLGAQYKPSTFKVVAVGCGTFS